MLKVIPLSFREANEFVLNFHRHNKPMKAGGKFCIGASDGHNLVGVAMVSNPIARRLDDGFTAEVRRTCVMPSAPRNVNSFLYGRCWRIWQQMGGKRLVTYTLQEEGGASLRGAGWKITGEVAPRKKEWKNWKSRPGREWQPVCGQLKFRWEPSDVEG